MFPPINIIVPPTHVQHSWQL
uniref:Uncharacterized protein n=1 Tax=Arundo donax TaxID=35708 RepID=A0A0A9BXJ9_ARUDO